MGTFMRDKCAARSMDGLPDGCNGNPKKTNPPTPVSGVAACAWEVMRPPKDLPPAIKRNPGASCRAALAHNDARLEQ